MAMFGFPSRFAPRDYTEGMSEEDATEFRALVNSIAACLESDEFIAKAVGYDALAVAKIHKDLVSLRNYDHLFPTGANPRDIVNAVKTGKTFRNGGLAGITVEQVEAHAIVAKVIEGATGADARWIKKIALMNPGKGDLIVEIIADRQIGDPEVIMEILAQSDGEDTQALRNGTL